MLWPGSVFDRYPADHGLAQLYDPDESTYILAGLGYMMCMYTHSYDKCSSVLSKRDGSSLPHTMS